MNLLKPIPKVFAFLAIENEDFRRFLGDGAIEGEGERERERERERAGRRAFVETCSLPATRTASERAKSPGWLASKVGESALSLSFSLSLPLLLTLATRSGSPETVIDVVS